MATRDLAPPTSTSPTSPTAGLRANHVADTRERIVRALNELLVETHPAALSVPAVAERAGASVRTVYRYFPTKGALLDAASDALADSTLVEFPRADRRIAGMDELLPALWTGLATNRELVDAQHALAESRASRRRRVKDRRDEVRVALDAEAADLDDDDKDALAAFVAAAISSNVLNDFLGLGLSPERAAAVTAFAIQAAVERAVRRGGIS